MQTKSCIEILNKIASNWVYEQGTSKLCMRTEQNYQTQDYKIEIETSASYDYPIELDLSLLILFTEY